MKNKENENKENENKENKENEKYIYLCKYIFVYLYKWGFGFIFANHFWLHLRYSCGELWWSS